MKCNLRKIKCENTVCKKRVFCIYKVLQKKTCGNLLFV